MKRSKTTILQLGFMGGIALGVVCGPAFADDSDKANCSKVPTWRELKTAINAIDATSTSAHGGFGLHMWTTIVNRDGYVCAVAFSGGNRGAQWPASRVISAQKASTANSLSTPAGATSNFANGLSLSTANLYASAQGGGTLFGVQFSNPVDTAAAYAGPPQKWGRKSDPMVDHKVGGHNVFGGGLALYTASGELVGALGSSGDTSCKDHNYAWQIRHKLQLDHVPAGVAGGSRPDNIIYDMTGLGTNGDTSAKSDLTSTSGFGHPKCGLGEDTISTSLPLATDP